MRTWSPQQERCLKDVGLWARRPASEGSEGLTYLLTGDAGAGKTTLACQFQEDVLAMGKTIAAYGYTGKSASVLRKKGFLDANTFHSDLYIPAAQSRKRLEEFQLQYDMADKELVSCTDEKRRSQLRTEIRDLREKINLEHEALHSPSFVLNTESRILDLDFLIADEVSMLGSRVGKDLEDTCRRGGVKMLLMGDPNQLPPVKDTAYYMNRKPDFHLDEIHRQAKDNPILHLAHLARKRERIPPGSYGESKVTRDLQAQEALDCNQMLVGRNKTRLYYCKRLREERGYKDLVEIGEKLMCLRNSKEGYFNGSIWFVEDHHGLTNDKERVHLSLRSEDPNVPTREALVHCKTLRGEEMHFMDAQGAQSMVSAEAATVHKFQGSEGDHIVLLDESHAAARDDWHKWLYTGITRAREKLTLVVD